MYSVVDVPRSDTTVVLQWKSRYLESWDNINWNGHWTTTTCIYIMLCAVFMLLLMDFAILNYYCLSPIYIQCVLSLWSQNLHHQNLRVRFQKHLKSLLRYVFRKIPIWYIRYNIFFSNFTCIKLVTLSTTPSFRCCLFWNSLTLFRDHQVPSYLNTSSYAMQRNYPSWVKLLNARLYIVNNSYNIYAIIVGLVILFMVYVCFV